MITWILTDDRIGSNNQSLAIGGSIDKDCIIKKIIYNKLIVLPNFIRQSSLLGINLKKSDSINSDLPDIVVCAGRRLSSVALNIKKKAKKKVFIINLMNPNLSFNKFDLIVLPKHDCTSKKTLQKYNNIIETNGTLNLVNKEHIIIETNKWDHFFKNYNKPIISLIIGGDTKEYKFDAKEFGLHIKQLSKIINNINGNLLITTSRRTSIECIEEMKLNLNCNYYLYDWKIENKKNELGNPYFAFLGLSDFLVVTGDSMSMVSECCSTGKPTYIYIPKDFSKKHRLFCKNLIDNNIAKVFNTYTEKLEEYEYKPLNEVERIKNVINNKLKFNDI